MAERKRSPRKPARTRGAVARKERGSRGGAARTGSGSARGARRGPARARVLGSQGEQTRKRLLDAAREVFRDRGYTATRVDDITERAGTSHGAFYLYFANKAEVLEALAAETSEEVYRLAETFEGIERGEAGFEQIRGWVNAFVDLYAHHAPVIIAWMMARPEDERFDQLGREVLRKLAGRIAYAIRDAQDGQPHPVQPSVAATALVAMLERFCFFWLVRGAEFDHDDAVSTLATILHQGIFGHSHRT